MNEILSLFDTQLFTTTIDFSTPIVLAAIGGVLCERGGIVNIGLEGFMNFSAFFAVVGTIATGNPWIGLVSGVIAGMIFSLIHGFATIHLHLDHVVSGAVINILSAGLTQYLLLIIYHTAGQTASVPLSLHDMKYAIPILSSIPYVGEIFFNQTPIVYIMMISVVIFTIFLNRTKLGLHLKVSGEHPMALETLGISVFKMRYLGVILSGLLCGLAGSYLSIETGSSYSENMTSGRGFIALAAVIAGRWSPIGALVASVVFGFINALQYKLQIIPALKFFPTEIFSALPYILSILAIAFAVKKSRPPKASGEDFIVERID